MLASDSLPVVDDNADDDIMITQSRYWDVGEKLSVSCLDGNCFLVGCT